MRPLVTVYAGFVDAGSPRGYDAALRRSQAGPPAVEDIAADPLAATKPDNRKGLTPEFAVNAALKTEEEPADGWRRSGFTAHLIAPDGGMPARGPGARMGREPSRGQVHGQ